MTLTDLDAAELLSGLAEREITAREAMRACLDRIAAVNPGINAVVALRDEATLMAEAEAADRAGPRGPLHGLPIAIKDSANARGIVSAFGSPILKDFRPAQDDLYVARIRAAGAIIIGKTNTPEFGLGSHTRNPVYGATGNPYDPGRSAGGSSGGAAAALATRMQWLSDGSDMMGSLRNPAGWCNVYGFRPSYGLVPGEEEKELFMSPVVTSGPMARSPGDLALLLDVMAGAAPGVPFSHSGQRYSGHLQADVRGRRIGWLGNWGGAWPMEEGVLDTCEAALATFEDLGCEVVALDPPFPAADLWQAWLDLRAFAVSAGLGPLYDNPDQRPRLRAEVIWEVERGRALEAVAIQRASAIRSAWFRKTTALFREVNALVMPTAQVWPFPLDWNHPVEIAGQHLDTYHRWMECVIPASIAGLPAIGVPAGFGAAGLPMGLQLVGPYRGDLGVLQLAQAWHDATGWPARRPPADPPRETA
ncbi:amidase [Pseudooceanicola batsensis HTCC2597]|uniref:Amidase n=1 Tax=Pseudooceanicola batsensis (strain ATCC BAA-863 / DSM 15984 / KCTC 12145 / HTCC2597) TaxID=252305 RepID=A3U2G5_PSEBH|nr:amidase [Pseudooceanicola batsensis]EAQ01765.1 amidase [Pseudooceanicola batsensis HTCC2597]